MKKCKYAKCGKEFIPKNNRQMFCSPICGDLHSGRKQVNRKRTKSIRNSKTIILSNGLEVLNNVVGLQISSGNYAK